jgi:hypothetical protein
MALYDLLADCQTYSGPGIVFSVMQPLKDRKNAPKIFSRYADPIVTDGKDPFVSLLISRNMNAGRPVHAKLYSIADKVLEQLHKLDVIPYHFRQRVTRNHCAALFNSHLHI